MAPSVEKKIAELEMGLLHLQQNIDIPEITLPVHPLVAAVIKRSVIIIISGYIHRFLYSLSKISISKIILLLPILLYYLKGC